MHACALGRSGQAYCWGENDYGDLGDGTTVSRMTPVSVAGEHRFTAMSAGSRVSCGLDRDGALWCWGRNNWGQLGAGRPDMEPHPTPVRVPAETRFRTVAVHEAVCATDTEGGAWCWGANGWGQGGTGPVDGETPCLSLLARGHCSAVPRPVREPR
jgi:alpha-tubulin suppressor-like RCC1 family protein